MNESINLDQTTIEQWIIAWIGKELKIPIEDIDVSEEFVNLGMGSRQAVFMMGDLEDWAKIELDPSIAWDYPTINSLAKYVLSLTAGSAD